MRLFAKIFFKLENDFSASTDAIRANLKCVQSQSMGSGLMSTFSPDNKLLIFLVNLKPGFFSKLFNLLNAILETFPEPFFNELYVCVTISTALVADQSLPILVCCPIIF